MGSMAITHNEIRRHPRWREEVNSPAPPGRVPARGLVGARGLIGLGAAILIIALLVTWLGG